MVPMAGIGPATSPLPRECSTTEPHGLILRLDLSLKRARRGVPSACRTGAGDGNRTRVISLEGWGSTIELLPLGKLERAAPTPVYRSIFRGGGGWIRTSVGVSQQIYSLPPLATRAPLRRTSKYSTSRRPSPRWRVRTRLQLPVRPATAEPAGNGRSPGKVWAGGSPTAARDGWPAAACGGARRRRCAWSARASPTA